MATGGNAGSGVHFVAMNTRVHQKLIPLVLLLVVAVVVAGALLGAL